MQVTVVTHIAGNLERSTLRAVITCSTVSFVVCRGRQGKAVFTRRARHELSHTGFSRCGDISALANQTSRAGNAVRGLVSSQF